MFNATSLYDNKGRSIMIINPDYNANLGLTMQLFANPSSKYTHMVVFSKYNADQYKQITENVYTDISEIKNILDNAKDKNIVLVFDHMINRDGINGKSKDKSHEDRKLKELILDSVHHNVTCVMLESHPLSLPIEVRVSFSHVFMNGGSEPSILKKLWKNYAGVIPDPTSFKRIHDQVCTNSRSYFVIMNTNSQDVIRRIACITAHDEYPIKKFSKLDINCKAILDPTCVDLNEVPTVNLSNMQAIDIKRITTRSDTGIEDVSSKTSNITLALLKSKVRNVHRELKDINELIERLERD